MSLLKSDKESPLKGAVSLIIFKGLLVPKNYVKIFGN